MVTLLFLIFFVFLFLGIPVAFSVGIATLLVLMLHGAVPLSIVAQKMNVALGSFSLLAIPFFIFAGKIMERGGITQKLVDLAQALVGWMTGGLSYVSILTGMLLGGISGSGSADTAALGSIMVPAMVKSGYPKDFSSALQAAAGSIGVIIPPSITMIVLGSITGVSVAKMFMGGVLPGIMVGILMMAAASIRCHKSGFGDQGKTPFSLKQLGHATWHAIPALLAPAIIVAGILGGIFTATEASVVVCAYALLLSLFLYHSITLKDIYTLLVESVVGSATVLIIIALSSAFGWVLTYLNFSTSVADFTSSLSSSPYILLIIINVFFLIGGMFLEGAALMIMLVPIMMPIAMAAGVNDLIFCLLITMNIVIGQLTPPVGTCLYVITAISGSKIERISIEVLPFIGAIILTMILCVIFPALVTWIPSFAI